jgi:hypothetical protein
MPLILIALLMEAFPAGYAAAWFLFRHPSLRDRL